MPKETDFTRNQPELHSANSTLDPVSVPSQQVLNLWVSNLYHSFSGRALLCTLCLVLTTLVQPVAAGGRPSLYALRWVFVQY